MNSDEYCSMISHSLMKYGKCIPHKKSHRKDKSRKRGNTCIHRWIYHTGSRCDTYKYGVLRIQILSAFPEAILLQKNNVKFIKAGVGGTPSELGMIQI